MRVLLLPSVDKSLEKTHEELGNMLSDGQAHPITYNHYYTDNIQKIREDASRKGLKPSIVWIHLYV